MGKMKDLSIDIENAIKNKTQFPEKFGEYIPDAICFHEMKKKSIKSFERTWGKSVECPKCFGYGGWILTLYAYKNNEPYHHFQASCSQCNGWGRVEAGSKSATCIHKWEEMSYQWCKENGVTHWGMCYHVYKCSECGEITAHDSSD